MVLRNFSLDMFLLDAFDIGILWPCMAKCSDGCQGKKAERQFFKARFFYPKRIFIELPSPLLSYQPQGPSSVMYYYPHFCGFAWNVSDGCAKEYWHTGWIYIFGYINFEVSATVWLYTIVMATFWKPPWISLIDWHSQLILKNRTSLDHNSYCCLKLGFLTYNVRKVNEALKPLQLSSFKFFWNYEKSCRLKRQKVVSLF